MYNILALGEGERTPGNMVLDVPTGPPMRAPPEPRATPITHSVGAPISPAQPPGLCQPEPIPASD